MKRSFDDSFLEMGTQGLSMFDAAGDTGALDDSDRLGVTNLDTDRPGRIPRATVARGTTLAGTIPLPKTDSAHIPASARWA